MDLKILDEGFLVQRAGVDPSTGDPWKPTWMSRSDCNENLVSEWESTRTFERRHISETLGDDVDLSWNDIASGAQSETWSSESRKRPAPDDWTRMSVNSEVQESDVDGQQSAVKRYNIDLSSRRPSYGPLTTGFKSSRTRPAVKKVQTTKLDTAPSFEHSVNDPPLMTGAEGPPTEISPEWLLGDLLKTEGIAVEVKYSRPANESLGWGKGDFEGTEGVVLSVLNLHNNMSTASVKLLDPHDGTQKVYPIPVKYLWPIPPYKAGQNAVILLGQFHGQVAKLRQLEDDVSVWLVSAGSCHFEIETEHMVLLHDVDADV